VGQSRLYVTAGMAEKRDASDAEEFRLRGNQALRDKNYDAAIEQYTKAIEADSTAYIAFSNRSAARLLLWSAKGKQNTNLLRDAEADARRCMKIDPSYAKAYVNASSALIRRRCYAQAEKVLKEGTLKCPRDENVRKKLETCTKLRKQHSLSHLLWGTPSAKSTTLVAPAHIFIVLNVVAYLVPVIFPTAIAHAAYFRALLGCVVVTLIGMFQSHGRPQFNKEYAARVIQDPSSTNLLLCGLMYSSRPAVLGIFAVSSMSFVHAAIFVYKIALAFGSTAGAATSAAGIVDRLVAPYMPTTSTWSTLRTDQKLYQFCKVLVRWNASAVVFLALLRLVELLSPARSLMSTFMIWQYLRMVATLETTKPLDSRPTRDTFARVDGKISQITGHPRCPAIIGSAYGKMKGFLASMTSMPTQAQAQASSGGVGGLGRMCVVM